MGKRSEVHPYEYLSRLVQIYDLECLVVVAAKQGFVWLFHISMSISHSYWESPGMFMFIYIGMLSLITFQLPWPVIAWLFHCFCACNEWLSLKGLDGEEGGVQRHAPARLREQMPSHMLPDMLFWDSNVFFYITHCKKDLHLADSASLLLFEIVHLRKHKMLPSWHRSSLILCNSYIKERFFLN